MICDRCNEDIPSYKSFVRCTSPRRILCHPCYVTKSFLARQVSTQRWRAKKIGEPDTLTVQQWEQTMDHFDWKCAYCQQSELLCLEHFIPLGMGLGTIQSNCVPACDDCNKKKRNTHPAIVKNIPQEAIERVRTYLMSFL